MIMVMCHVETTHPPAPIEELTLIEDGLADHGACA